MSKLPIHQHYPDASQLVFGTMNLGGGWNNNPISKADLTQAHELLETCASLGINIIDLADIYTFGKAETVIGQVFRENKSLRNRFIVQSKVGIRLGPDVKVNHYDLSASWVTKAVYASLERLGLDGIDILFLHRSDPLMEIEPLCEALNNLHNQNKFSALAVSNMHAGQMALIQTHIEMPLIANQLELSLAHSGFVEEGMTTNMDENASCGFPRGTLEFCQQQGVQLQAWGALAQGKYSSDSGTRGNTEQDSHVANTQSVISRIAREYKVSSSAIVLAWLMRHPQNIQPVVGSTKASRIEEAHQALGVKLTREQWYEILQARRGGEVP
ncbi:aldo/keto reductase [Ningiella sp. W23]|uniref:aldo/keto reductase n=1 Tax=Ningiella sp. W23 TaxID=3023715 RepID=UPI0037569EA4